MGLFKIFAENELETIRIYTQDMGMELKNVPDLWKKKRINRIKLPNQESMRTFEKKLLQIP